MSKPQKFAMEITDEILDSIEEHCFSEIKHEVGGFLIGTLSDDAVSITRAVPATKAQSQQTSLTFTHEAWDEAYSALEAADVSASIVGWYHSHPGFGVFMSDYDTFIQENFFGSPGQVALVVDPLAGELGWFKWSDGKLVDLMKGSTSRAALKGDEEHAITKQNFAEPSDRTSFRPGTILGMGVTVLAIGLAGFFLGQAVGKSQVPALRQQISAYSQEATNWNFEFNALVNSIQGTFLAGQDAARKRIYLAYPLTPGELGAGEAWIETVALKFAVTPEQILQANPGLKMGDPAMQVVAVPVFGSGSPIPVPAPTPIESTSPTASPSSKSSMSPSPASPRPSNTISPLVKVPSVSPTSSGKS